MAVKQKVERRRQSRQNSSGAVLILWTDESGSERVSRASCLDVSPLGIKLRLSEKIASRVPVLVNCQELGIGGQGIVRYCVCRKQRFEIGVECPAGTGWRRLSPAASADRPAQ
jgi:hypothetical protein